MSYHKFSEKLDVSKSVFLKSLNIDDLIDLVWSEDEYNKDNEKWNKDTYIKQIGDFLTKVIKKNGSIDNQQYKYSSILKDKGRQYIKRFGIQSLQHDLRDFLIRHRYFDLDMVNCHPSILNYLVKEWFPNSVFPKLDYYCNNRDEILGDNKDVIKRQILTALNWDKPINSDNDFLNELDKEFKIIQDEIYKKSDIGIDKKGMKKENKKGSFIDRVLTIYENKILMECCELIGFNNIGVLMFDGVLVDINCNKEEILIMLNEHCLKYNVKWICKEMKNDIEESDIYIKYLEDKEKEEERKEMEVNERNLLSIKETLETVKEQQDLLYSKSYKKVKEKFEKENFMVSNPLLFGCEKDNQVVLYNKQDFSTISATYEFVLKVNDRIIQRDFFSQWLKDEDKRIYKNVDFIPKTEIKDKKVYNMFKGFDCINIKDYKIDDEMKEGWKIFKELIGVLTNNEKECETYLLNYIADIFQHPDVNPLIGVILRSKIQGVGKNSLVQILSKIMDFESIHSKYLLEGGMEDVIGVFSKDLSQKMLIAIDEVNSQQGFENNDKLKKFITEEKRKINEKNVKSYHESNWSRVFAFSNNNNPIKLEENDRRFVVFKAGKPKDRSFYNKLHSYRTNKKVLTYIYYQLMNIDLTEFDIKERVITKAYKDMQNNNRNPIYDYLYELINDGKIKEELEGLIHKTTKNILFKPTIFYSQYKNYLQQNNHTSILKNFNSRNTKSILLNMDMSFKKYKINNKTTDYYSFNQDNLLKYMIDNNLINTDEVIEIDNDEYE